MTEIFILLIVFQAKHFLCDFPLQGRYMLGKFAPDWSFVRPLAAHAAVHAVATWTIAAWWLRDVPRPTSVLLPIGLAAADFATHFVVDRVKASPRLLGRWKPDRPQFWWALGADQSAHHLTHYAIIAAILGAAS
jgi:hypothetical protein